MSTAPETQPEAVPPTPAKPPFYRRPLVLIIAGAVVLLLIAGAIVTTVTLNGASVRPRVAAAATDKPTKATPFPTRTSTPTPTPTPGASVAQPQAGAAPPAKAAPVAPVAPAAPAAPVAPVAPAPAPPGNAGPGRTTSGVAIQTFAADYAQCPSGPVLTTQPFTVQWASTGATKWTLSDEYGYIGSAKALSSGSGSLTFNMPCNSKVDLITLLVQKLGIGGTSATAYAQSEPQY